MAFNTGRVINNRYRVVHMLAEGGFGAVYKAWDIIRNEPFALKHNLDSSAEAQSQFEREAQVLGSLSHPNLPRVSDHFFVPGQGQFLVMTYVEGVDLQTLLEQQGCVLEEKVLAWTGQITDALTYLHNQPQPIIHRDIKPANIRITPQDRAILVDFGLVKVYDQHLKTTMGARAVTPGYSPPEQYGQGNTDARTDIYALSATVYTLLTGQEPQESVQRIVDDQVAPANTVAPMTSAKTSSVLLKGMALRPAERFQTAESMYADLSRSPAPKKSTGAPIITPPATSSPPRLPAPLQSPYRQVARAKSRQSASFLTNNLDLVLGAVLLLLLVVAVLFSQFVDGRNGRVVDGRATITARAAEWSSTRSSRASAESTITARVDAESTTTARALAWVTVTARAQVQATARAEATALFEQEFTDMLSRVEEEQELVFGAASGSLAHRDDDLIKTDSANVSLKNFVAEARFLNPYGSETGDWDYGFLFRDEDSGELRLAVQMQRGIANWSLTDRSADDFEFIEGGDLELNDGKAKSNKLKLIAVDDRGYLFVNDDFVAELDLSSRMSSGDILVATGIKSGDEIEGERTGYNLFTARSLP